MSSWWTEKLAGQTPTPRQVPPMAPPPQQPQPQQHGYASGYAITQPPANAQVLNVDSNCPSCGSGNYMPRGGPNAKTVNTQTGGSFAPASVCFDCGFPTEQYSSHTGTGGSLMATQAASEVRGKGQSARIAGTFTTGFHARDSGAHHDGPNRLANGRAL